MLLVANKGISLMNDRVQFKRRIQNPIKANKIMAYNNLCLNFMSIEDVL